MVVAAGLPADQLDLDAFMAQAMEYENWEDSHDRIRRFFNEINATHSHAVRRVSEVMKWVQSGEYDRIIRGEYRKRGDETNVRAEASDAVEYYAERFRALFRELGENVTNLGSQMGDVSQQVAEWLRNRGGPGGLGRPRRPAGAIRRRTASSRAVGDGRPRRHEAKATAGFRGVRRSGRHAQQPIDDKPRSLARVCHQMHTGRPCLRQILRAPGQICHASVVAATPQPALRKPCCQRRCPLPPAPDLPAEAYGPLTNDI